MKRIDSFNVNINIKMNNNNKIRNRNSILSIAFKLITRMKQKTVPSHTSRYNNV